MASCGDDQRRMIDVADKHPHLFYDLSAHGECHQFPGMDCNGWDSLLWMNYGLSVYHEYNRHLRHSRLTEADEEE